MKLPIHRKEGDLTLIIGAGEVGFYTAKRLAQEDRRVVVIDTKSEQLQRIQNSLDVRTVMGSGASPKVLEEADIRYAHTILAVTDSDEVNIMACMFAKALAPNAVKLARIRSPEYALYPSLLEDVLQINLLVNPEDEIVRTISRLLTLPGAVECSEFAGGRVRMTGIRMERGPLIGEPLAHFPRIMKDSGVMVGAIDRGGSLIIPSGQDRILKGDVVYFAYRPENQSAILRCAERERLWLQDICIFGGDSIGLRLAERCEHKGIRVKLIEPSAKRCRETAERLNNTVVLHGEGTDSTLLKEEHIGEMCAFAAVSPNENANILACMVAKSLGVGETVARVHQNEYLQLVETLGIDHAVCPRVAAVNGLLHYIRRGKVVASVTVGQDAAEAMEVMISEDSALAGRPVSELNLPRGVLLLTVIRENDVFLPKGTSVLEPGDRVLFMTAKERIPEIEAILTAQRKESK